MAYVASSDILAYGDFVSTDDEALLTGLISRAEAIIEQYTGRDFEGSSDILYFDSSEDVDGRTLYLLEDLVSITSITNGDSDAGDINSTDYVTGPTNDAPIRWITLRASHSKYWSEDTNSDPENAIQVDGKWGYSAAPPGDIKQAAIRLTLWLYKQRETNVDLDRPVLTNDGVTIMPAQLPGDVTSILDEYREVRVR